MKLQLNRHSALAGALLLALAQSSLCAEQAPLQKVGPKNLDPAQIQQIVRQYILDNPEVVIESVRLFQQKAQMAEKQKSKDAVAAHRGDLQSDPSSPVLALARQAGEPVTVVEFFDYRCGYCKKVDDQIVNLGSKPGVRVVYKDFPILGAESLLAAQAALAAKNQGAYQQFHHALITSSTPLTPEAIEKIASNLKLDVARLKKDMAGSEVDAALKRNYALAGALGVKSTPSFVIGNDLISGAMTDDALVAAINNAQSDAKTTHVPAHGGGL